MSNYLNSERMVISDVHIFKANSIYLNKIYQEEKQRKKQRDSNNFWNAIEIENIFKPIDKSFERKSSYSKKSSISKNPNNCSDDSRSHSKNSKISEHEQNGKNKKVKKSNLHMKKKEKNEKKQQSFEDISDLFKENMEKEKREKKMHRKNQNEQNVNEKENSFSILNKTIDDFEKTLEEFYEERKENKLVKSSSSKSLENLKNLQKSLSQIEDDMDKRLKIVQPNKTTMEILAENIEKQQFFTTNEDLYEISFQQKP